MSKGGVDWIVQERTQAIGHLTCAILVLFPGAIIIHDAKVILIADFPILAFWLTVATMLPAATLTSSIRVSKTTVTIKSRNSRTPECKHCHGDRDRSLRG
ncbi:hypothetical protein PISMIDRAFT_680726, partial [Pisolithus microcarpus 441]